MTQEKATETKTALERAKERAEKASTAAAEAAKRARQARAKLAQMEARKNKPARNADFRRKVIVGAIVLKDFPELLPQILAKLPAQARKAYDEATSRATDA